MRDVLPVALTASRMTTGSGRPCAGLQELELHCRYSQCSAHPVDERSTAGSGPLSVLFRSRWLGHNPVDALQVLEGGEVDHHASLLGAHVDSHPGVEVSGEKLLQLQ